MSGDEVLAALQALFAVGGVVTMLASALLRRDDAVLGSAAVALTFSNTTPVCELGSGVGAPWLVIGSTAAVLAVYFRLRPAQILFGHRGLHEGLWLAGFGYMLVLAFASSPDTTSSLRKLGSAALVAWTGWNVLGSAIASDPARLEQVRHRMRVVVYMTNASTIALLAALLLVQGPAAFQPNRYSHVQLGDVELSRLQIDGLLNATGVGIMAVNGLLVVAHWFVRSARWVVRIACVALGAGLLVVLLWSNARGSLLGGWVTLLFALAFSALVSWRRRVVATAAIVANALSPLLLRSYWEPLIFRADHPSASMADVAYSDRIGPAMQVIAAAGSDAWIYGQGFGASDFYARRVRFFEIESFPAHLLLEWGVFGGLAYLAILVGASWAIVRLDWREARAGEPGAWLFGAGFAFQWALSPFSYSFGLFAGPLAVMLSIASASVAATRARA